MEYLDVKIDLVIYNLRDKLISNIDIDDINLIKKEIRELVISCNEKKNEK